MTTKRLTATAIAASLFALSPSGAAQEAEQSAPAVQEAQNPDAPAAPSEEITAAEKAELEMIGNHLKPSALKALGQPALMQSRLPLYRVELEFDPAVQLIRGREHIVFFPKKDTDELVLFASASAAKKRAVLNVIEATVNGKAVRAVPRRTGFVSLYLPAIAPAGTRQEISLRFSLEFLCDGKDRTLANQGDMFTEMMRQFAMLSGMAPPAADKADKKPSDATPRNISYCDGAHAFLAGVIPELVQAEGQAESSVLWSSVGEMLWSPLANYVVTLITPPGFETGGTGSVIGSFPERDGRLRTTRIAAAVRGFTLAIAKDWKAGELKAAGTRVRYLWSEEEEAIGKKHLDVVQNALEWFSANFGEYPWSSFELALTPMSLSYQEAAPNALFVAPEGDSQQKMLQAASQLYPGADAAANGMLEFQTAHFVAHQWFRGLVGSNALDDPAADEAPANYAACLYVEHRRGTKAGAVCRKEHFEAAYRQHRMMGGRDLPLDTPLDGYETSTEEQAVLHAKGGALHDKMRSLMGKKAYLTAARRHVNRHAFSSVTSTDFTADATEGLSPDKTKKLLSLSDRFLHKKSGDEDIGKPYTVNEILKGQNLPPEMEEMVREMLQSMIPDQRLVNEPAGNDGDSSGGNGL